MLEILFHSCNISFASLNSGGKNVFESHCFCFLILFYFMVNFPINLITHYIESINRCCCVFFSFRRPFHAIDLFTPWAISIVSIIHFLHNNIFFLFFSFLDFNFQLYIFFYLQNFSTKKKNIEIMILLMINLVCLQCTLQFVLDA